MNPLVAKLIAVLIIVETGGNSSAVGDGGRARGVLQIHQACWIDACEELGVDWDYERDSFDPVKSQAVCAAYLARWGRYYERQTGQPATIEVFARIWNGGPSWTKEGTEGYWQRVKTALKEKGFAQAQPIAMLKSA